LGIEPTFKKKKRLDIESLEGKLHAHVSNWFEHSPHGRLQVRKLHRWVLPTQQKRHELGALERLLDGVSSETDS
jgi:hypothetical protein